MAEGSYGGRYVWDVDKLTGDEAGGYLPVQSAKKNVLAIQPAAKKICKAIKGHGTQEM
jgi:hypothetical protein